MDEISSAAGGSDGINLNRRRRRRDDEETKREGGTPAAAPAAAHPPLPSGATEQTAAAPLASTLSPFPARGAVPRREGLTNEMENRTLPAERQSDNINRRAQLKVQAAPEDDRVPSGTRRQKRTSSDKAVSKELEQKREASRISSRKSQERKKQRIDFLSSEQTRLIQSNAVIRNENQYMKNEIERLKSIKDRGATNAGGATPQFFMQPQASTRTSTATASAAPRSMLSAPTTTATSHGAPALDPTNNLLLNLLQQQAPDTMNIPPPQPSALGNTQLLQDMSLLLGGTGSSSHDMDNLLATILSSHHAPSNPLNVNLQQLQQHQQHQQRSLLSTLFSNGLAGSSSATTAPNQSARLAEMLLSQQQTVSNVAQASSPQISPPSLGFSPLMGYTAGMNQQTRQELLNQLWMQTASQPSAGLPSSAPQQQPLAPLGSSSQQADPSSSNMLPPSVITTTAASSSSILGASSNAGVSAMNAALNSNSNSSISRSDDDEEEVPASADGAARGEERSSRKSRGTPKKPHMEMK